MDKHVGTRGRWVMALLIAVAIAGFFLLGGHRYLSFEVIRNNLDAFQRLADERPVVVLGTFFAVYVAVTALSLPVATPLTLLAGALFGRWFGTGIVSIAATCGATLAFLMSRYLFREWVQRRFGKRLAGINRGIERDGGYYLLTLRLVPLFPFWLINLGMGLTSIRTVTFAAVSWAGMLLGTFLYVNVGTELATLESPAGLLSPSILISLTLLGVVPLVIRKLLRPKRNVGSEQ